MSWAINIFINGANSIHSLADDINDILKTNLKKTDNIIGNEYSESGEYLYLSLVDEHGLENDGNMNFEDFLYELNISARMGGDPEGIKQKCYRFGQEVFIKLKDTNRYNLMMTEDLQKKMECFNPVACQKNT